MGNVSAAFVKLPERLWKGRHLSVKVMCKVNQAVVLSSRLYGPETWAIYQESSEEAPSLYHGASKSNNERTMEGQDHECGNSLPYRTNFND